MANAAGHLSYYNASNGSFINTEMFNLTITGLTCTGRIVLLTSTDGLRLVSAPFAPTALWNFRVRGNQADLAPGVLLNGDMFAAGVDGTVRAFTIPGRAIA